MRWRFAESGGAGEVRFLGEVENRPATIEKTINKLAKRYDRLHVCFEAGPTGYGLCRQVRNLGHDCMVVAPALIPKRSGERVRQSAGRGDPGAVASGRRDDQGLGSRYRARGGARPGPRGRPDRTICAGSASSCSPSSFGMVGSTTAAVIGRWRTGTGSSPRRNRLSSRRRSTRSRMQISGFAGWTRNWPPSCRAGPWRRSSRLISRCAASRFWSPRLLRPKLGMYAASIRPHS